MGVDNTFWLAGVLAETAVVSLLVYRRAWRILPVFFIYCIWGLITDAGNYPVWRFFHNRYLTVYLIETALDSVLQFSVLVELTWSVLRPIRASLPRRSLVIVGLVLVTLCSVIWPFSGIEKAQLSTQAYLLANMQQTVSILRILFFLALAGCSQLLSIGWRDRELQVATGLGFYSLVSLGAAMLRAHQTSVFQYSHLNRFVVASSVLSLLYWAFSFAQKETVRREFTPQMQNLLLAMAGVAQANRVALADSVRTETRECNKH
ncbi:MAG: hypothetical protein KGM96_16310 [Acidobacteriota bacterium]|nr:hypothetical protein [Acidobacteriota bacterium]